MSLLTRATGSVLFLTNNCYCKLTVNCGKVKLYKRHFSKLFSHSERMCNVRFSNTDTYTTQSKENQYIVYDDLLLERRAEARRSIVVEIQSDKSCADLYGYCSQFGKIHKIFHYANHRSERHFVLIEFENQEYADAILSSSTHVNFEQIIPVQSSMLWFRNVSNQTNKVSNVNTEEMKLIKFSSKILNDVEVYKKLACAESVSDQIMTLYNSTKLNDVGVRLRFFTAYQIERCFSGLFPNIAVLPFGSSVNGFGKQGCDLDLSLVLDKDKIEKNTSRLVFQTKSVLLHEKQQVKRLMESIADIMHIFLPGVSNIRKILEARVPIIKLDHKLCGIECDLSITNMTAYYMSEMLYMFGEIDWRVRPLTFVVRKWAESLNLTNKMAPGPWITNFSISLMVIFFLQQKKILPSLNFLKSQAAKEDVRIADAYVDCTFLRDIKKLTKSNNTDSLEILLLEFFTYYGNFDFESKALSLRHGKSIPKPEYSALYISNPLETGLNVSKNVKYEELQRIRIAMRSASWKLESTNDESHKWGLINLFIVENDSLFESGQKQKKSIDFASLFSNTSEKDAHKDKNSIRKRINDKKKQWVKSKLL